MKQRAGVEFLLTELKTGGTFVELARQSVDNGKIRRNRQNARKAYDSVLKFIDRVVLSDGERSRIDDSLRTLKNSLKKLGEQF
jgi:hypothetical protein